jgi:TRAP-type C4-dicarboxylate transport system substrate-binding protein
MARRSLLTTALAASALLIVSAAAEAKTIKVCHLVPHDPPELLAG